MESQDGGKRKLTKKKKKKKRSKCEDRMRRGKTGVELELTMVWGGGQTFESREGKSVARRLGCCGCGCAGRLFRTLLGNRKGE